MNVVLGVEHGKVKQEGVVVIGHPQEIDDLHMMKVIIGIIREEEVMTMMITTTAAAVAAGMVVDGVIYMTLQDMANLVEAVRNMKQKKRMTLAVVHVKSKTRRNQNGRHTLSHRADLLCLMHGLECFMNHTRISFTIPRRSCIILTRSNSILHIKQK